MEKSHRDIAIIILVDKDHKILLQHRAHDAWIFPDHWGFFGGGVETGETSEIAVKRETQEEIGYALSNPQLVLTTEFEGEKNFVTMYIFIEKYDGQQPIVLGEGQNYGWYSLAELSKLKLSPHVPNILKQIESYI
jgi:mutator protein MutT